MRHFPLSLIANQSNRTTVSFSFVVVLGTYVCFSSSLLGPGLSVLGSVLAVAGFHNPTSPSRAAHAAKAAI